MKKTTFAPPPSIPLRSRAIWDAGRSLDASLSDRIKPYLYELGLLSLSIENFSSAANSLHARVTAELAVLRKLFLRLKSGIHDVLDAFLAHYEVILTAVLFFAALYYVQTTYGGGQLLFSVTCLALIFHYGFEEGGDGRLSGYSVFNGFISILGSVDANVLAAQYAGGGLAGAAGQRNIGGGEDSEGEDGDVLGIEDDGEDGAGGVANLPVRRRTKKKTKGRRDEIEARRERQFQMQAAREEHFQQAMMGAAQF